tara:strand:- start:2528 stop:2701 length:174 start_codon:yes stop_codon:yes gene_type:complete
MTLQKIKSYIFNIKAGWQSGYAEDCKSLYAGSIPTPASNLCPGGGIGRRKGLKIPRR